ncbi:hypothetical protein [Noviherbaspirillum humi]|nr:hypothetical protein [Noviherbaspirillum humi]
MHLRDDTKYRSPCRRTPQQMAACTKAESGHRGKLDRANGIRAD